MLLQNILFQPEASEITTAFSFSRGRIVQLEGKYNDHLVQQYVFMA